MQSFGGQTWSKRVARRAVDTLWSMPLPWQRQRQRCPSSFDHTVILSHEPDRTECHSSNARRMPSILFLGDCCCCCCCCKRSRCVQPCGGTRQIRRRMAASTACDSRYRCNVHIWGRQYLAISIGEGLVLLKMHLYGLCPATRRPPELLLHARLSAICARPSKKLDSAAPKADGVVRQLSLLRRHARL